MTAPENTQSNDQTEPTQTQLELFTGPKPIDLKPPRYPRTEQRLGKEGWVQVNFMISPEGKPYEIVVTDSTGIEAFEKAAVRTVKDWTFEQALMDGVPIDAGSIHRISFELTGPGNVGARKSFIRAVRKLSKSISDEDQESSEAALTGLEPQNLYEDAYLNIAWFNYFKKWGTERQQLGALRRGIAYKSNAQYLPKDLYVSSLLSMFVLEINAQDFARALATWEMLEAQELDEKKMTSLQSAVDDILVLKGDDRSYDVPGRIGANSSWWYRLLKNSFSVIVTSGAVAEIKLRCDRKYVFFRYEPDIQYRISDNYGSCGIELVGDPGTTFSLVQSRT
jgi:TonB family protein